MTVHPFDAVFNERSRVLVLGSFPSVLSRENGFYYGNPRNRFWQVLSSVLGEDLPEDTNEKTALLLRHGIALWDVLKECEIEGSSDLTIKNETPNDIRALLEGCPIKAVFTNGKAAHRLYGKYFPDCVKDVCLPSTSPANAAWGIERLKGEWGKIQLALEGLPSI